MPSRFQINFAQIAEFCSFEFVWRGFLFLWVLGMGYIIVLWHSLSLPYNYFDALRPLYTAEVVSGRSVT